MALSDAEALKMDRSAAADVLCGCAFCILTTVQTDGFDRCPRFLRRHEVCYMEAYADKSFDVVIVSNTIIDTSSAFNENSSACLNFIRCNYAL